jgi:hypothetical protein
MRKNNQIVYVLTNEAMPNLVKIGKTTRSDVKTRMSELYSSGVPYQFECVYAVEVNDCSTVEKALHVAFNPNRVNPKREFFSIDPEQVIAILKLLGTQDVTPMLNNDLNSNVSATELEAVKQAKKKRPNINYFEMGLEKDTVMTFVNDPEITVTIASEKKVMYNEEEMSLTRVTKELLELDYAVQPTKYWIVNGKNLRDIWEETYVDGDM